MTKKLSKVLGFTTVTSAAIPMCRLIESCIGNGPFRRPISSATTTRISVQRHAPVTARQQLDLCIQCKAGGIASATETSQFSFADNKITLQSLAAAAKILIHNNTLSINFNPASKVINTKKMTKTRSFAWQGRMS